MKAYWEIETSHYIDVHSLSLSVCLSVCLSLSLSFLHTLSLSAIDWRIIKPVLLWSNMKEFTESKKNKQTKTKQKTKQKKQKLNTLSSD